MKNLSSFYSEHSRGLIRKIVGYAAGAGAVFAVGIVLVGHLLSGRRVDFADFEDRAQGPSIWSMFVQELAWLAVIGIAFGLGLALSVAAAHHPWIQAKIDPLEELVG